MSVSVSHSFVVFTKCFQCFWWWRSLLVCHWHGCSLSSVTFASHESHRLRPKHTLALPIAHSLSNTHGIPDLPFSWCADGCWGERGAMCSVYSPFFSISHCVLFAIARHCRQNRMSAFFIVDVILFSDYVVAVTRHSTLTHMHSFGRLCFFVFVFVRSTGNSATVWQKWKNA